jgi:uncharacterized membrane protein
MRDVLFFDKMITPKIITFIYWVLLVVVVIGGLGWIFAGHGNFFGRLFAGIFGAVAGAIAVRIWCELLIVLFKMNEALQEIRKK